MASSSNGPRDTRGLVGVSARGRTAVFVVLTAAIGGGVTSPGCAAFDVTPVAATHGTLGEEVVQVFCERMAREADPTNTTGVGWKEPCAGEVPPPAGAPPRMIALLENRERLATALDQTLPSEMGDELGHFLGELMPFFDRPDERLPTQTRRLADFLTRLSSDEDAIAALERLGQRQGYRPLRLALGVTRPVLAYPDFDQFSDLALNTIMNGAAEEEFRDLQRALALEMATLEPSEPAVPGEATTLELTRQLMFTEDDSFGVGAPQHVLLRDSRGMAAIELASDGSLPLPFVDRDVDGLADVDSLGRFTTGTAPVGVPSPFPLLGEAAVPRDPAGRALRTDGTRYYRYLDANRTMLAGTVGELSPWFSPTNPIVLQMSRGLPVMMGPEQMATTNYGSYALTHRSFDTDAGPMFDLVHALGEILHRDQTYNAILAVDSLLRDEESAAAGIVRAARHLANASDDYPNADLVEGNVFFDDLIALVMRMAAHPGMLDAVMRSFSDPDSAAAGTLYAEFMTNRDRITYNASNPDGPVAGLPLDQPVDHSAPDTFDNESLFQRTLALIDGLNGVTVCNRAGATLTLVVDIPIIGPTSVDYPGTFDECELLRIDNVAEAYSRAILGEYELILHPTFLNWLTGVADDIGINVDRLLEESSGITGLTRHPTPRALNRLVFWGLSNATGTASCVPDDDGGNCNSEFAGQLLEPVRDRHGNLVIERYHGTIFAWEIPGFYDGMRPLVDALHRPGFTNDTDGTYFFGELLGRLSRHWASPGNTQTCGPGECAVTAPNFSYQSNVRSYEPLIAEGFEEGQLAVRLHEMNLALERVQISPGYDGIAVLSDAAENMIDPAANPGMTDRQGRTTTSWNDGSRTVPVTPLYLILDALSGVDDAWAGEDARHADWLNARHGMAEQFLATTTLGTEFRLANQRGRSIILTVIPFLLDRINAHYFAGDLVEWSTGLHEQLADFMQEPLMGALVYFLDAVNEDTEARDALAALVAYLMDRASENDAFSAMLYGGADALMVLEDDTNILPLIHALSESMAPNVDQSLMSGVEPDIDASMVRDTLDLVGDIAEVDEERTLRRVLQNAVALPESGDLTTPLEVILDVIAEINRAVPNEGGTLAAEDYRAVIGNVTGFILDEDHGMERLNVVVQNRRCFPEENRVCTTAGSTMTSEGLCYVGATCRCNDNAGALTWQCSRP